MVHDSHWDGSTVILLALDSFVSNTCGVLALKATVLLLAHAAIFLALGHSIPRAKALLQPNSILSTVYLHVVNYVVRTTREAFGFCVVF